MKNLACIWLALFCILSIISCRISLKLGDRMDMDTVRKDEPVAWIMLAIAVVLWFV